MYHNDRSNMLAHQRDGRSPSTQGQDQPSHQPTVSRATSPDSETTEAAEWFKAKQQAEEARINSAVPGLLMLRNSKELAQLRDALLRQDTYERFDQMLLQQEPFKPSYRPQTSRQSSHQLHGFGGRFTT